MMVMCSGSYRRGCRCDSCKDKKRNEVKRVADQPVVDRFSCSITCPVCESSMRWVTGGVPQQTGTYSTAIWSCDKCRRRFQLTQTLRQI